MKKMSLSFLVVVLFSTLPVMGQPASTLSTLQKSPLHGKSYFTGKNKNLSPVYRRNLTKNGELKMDSVVLREFYVDADHWVNESKFVFGYDAQNRCNLENHFIWDENYWMNVYQTKYTFNEQGHIDTIVSAEWDDLDEEWEWDEKTIYRYTTGRALESILSFSWDISTGNWSESNKWEYVYDTDNQLSEIFYFSKSSADWVMNGKYEYFYENQNLIREISYTDPEDWRAYRKIEYSYDNTHRLIKQTEFEQGVEDEDWIEVDQLMYEYDANGDVPALRGYFRNEEDELEESYRIELAYNTEYSIENIFFPDMVWEEWENLSFSHMITEQNSMYMDEETQDWLDEMNVKFYYSPVSTVNVEEYSPDLHIRVAPNPATTRLYIITGMTYERMIFELYDLAGRKVLRTPVYDGSVNVEGIKAGMYIYQIIAGKKTTSGKLIVK